MSTFTIALLAAVVVGLLVLVGRTYAKMRGTRLVTCPENNETAAVEVDATRAAALSLLGQREVRLKDCSRWPEKEGCGQDCLRQIESAPDDCLVRTILTLWYADKSCVVCGKELGQIDWMERRPGLLAPDGTTVDWQHLVPEKIPETLSTHRAVCFDCHVSESFRRMHPDLVIDRPWDRSGLKGNH